MKARARRRQDCLAAAALPAAFRPEWAVSLHHERHVRQQIIIRVSRASRLFMYSIKLMFML